MSSYVSGKPAVSRGHCAQCDESIEPGEMVKYTGDEDDRLRHVDCNAHYEAFVRSMMVRNEAAIAISIAHDVEMRKMEATARTEHAAEIVINNRKMAFVIDNLLESMSACCDDCRFQESNVQEATRQAYSLEVAGLLA